VRTRRNSSERQASLVRLRSMMEVLSPGIVLAIGAEIQAMAGLLPNARFAGFPGLDQQDFFDCERDYLRSRNIVGKTPDGRTTIHRDMLISSEYKLSSLLERLIEEDFYPFSIKPRPQTQYFLSSPFGWGTETIQANEKAFELFMETMNAVYSNESSCDDPNAPEAIRRTGRRWPFSVHLVGEILAYPFFSLSFSAPNEVDQWGRLGPFEPGRLTHHFDELDPQDDVRVWAAKSGGEWVRGEWQETLSVFFTVDSPGKKKKFVYRSISFLPGKTSEALHAIIEGSGGPKGRVREFNPVVSFSTFLSGSGYIRKIPTLTSDIIRTEEIVAVTDEEVNSLLAMLEEQGVEIDKRLVYDFLVEALPNPSRRRFRRYVR